MIPNLIWPFIILQIIFDHFISYRLYSNTLIGILLIFLGQIPNFWVYFIGIEKTKKLFTHGLFRYSRNPNYLGMVVTLLGVSLILGSLISYIFPIIFFFLLYFTIFEEEKELEKKYGKKYLNYKKKVRRWI